MNQNQQPQNPSNSIKSSFQDTPPSGANNQSQPHKSENKKLIIIILAVVFVPIIIIVGILVVLVLTNLNSSRSKVRDVQTISEMNNVFKALNDHYQSNNSVQGFVLTEKYCSSCSFQALGENTFIISAPIPSQPGKYYCINSSGETYEVEKEILDTKSCGAKKLNK
ncbi:MAG TPA: hypothetical protein VJK26_03780 [Patescibacteria group bacterium]|nr:hypothetical protein [Patescibacteria group bacterium]